MLLAFKSIALRVRKHCSQSPKAFIPVFEKKVLFHFDLTYTHFTLNYSRADPEALRSGHP